MSAGSPLVTQATLCLAVLGLMVLAGVKKRRLELRSVPIRLPRWRDWRRLLGL
jgi:hypothetical protein